MGITALHKFCVPMAGYIKDPTYMVTHQIRLLIERFLYYYQTIFQHEFRNGFFDRNHLDDFRFCLDEVVQYRKIFHNQKSAFSCLPELGIESRQCSFQHPTKAHGGLY
jgi:hypothetical protein